LIDELRTKLSHDLDKDLKTFRPEILSMLADEIIGRYYFQKGRIEYMLRDDHALERAQALLASPDEFRKLLKW